MITDKQRQYDYEYEADYQTKSRYTTEQWSNILDSGLIKEEDLSLLEQVYSSYNHAANLLQLSFHQNLPQEEILNHFNTLGQTIGEANDLSPEVDYSGEEYWWYLFFWGKQLPEKILEFKMHPELTEAIALRSPELEQAYYSFFGSIERSKQIRYNPEDSVWIATALLHYEKYYRNPGINSDDILLMQYEIQTRAQKIYGQDVNANTITKICNADERGNHFNYLRDLYKYYRVSFPGEFDEDRERPDPEDLDYNAYVYSLFGYMTIHEVYDFIAHEYSHLVDDSYVELTSGNGFVRMANFLSRQSGVTYSSSDSSDQMIELRATGEDVEETFHMLGDALIKEYPNFTYGKKASWLGEDGKTAASFSDVLLIPDYSYTNASIAVTTLVGDDSLDIEISLNLPKCADEEAMLDIQDKCNMLTLMTQAPFQVGEQATEYFDLISSGEKIKAKVIYHYTEIMTMSEENIIGMTATALQIFASYYTDLCQNYYPKDEDVTDPLSAALGDKLVYRKAADVPNPTVIYKEATYSPSTDFIEKALQNYGREQAPAQETESTEIPSKEQENISEEPPKSSSFGSGNSSPSSDTGSNDKYSSIGNSDKRSNTGNNDKRSSAGSSKSSSSASSQSASQGWQYSPVPVSTHPNRAEQSFKLYPKNTLIQGPVKTGKFHEALTTAVGIIEGKDPDMMKIEPIPDVLDLFKQYEEEGRILHISYPDIDARGYDGWIEGFYGNQLQDGIFKTFANQCGEGRYVVLMEDVDLNWMHLFGETSVLLRDNRREGASSETIITLHRSKQPFKLPANLYIVATCDSVVCEDTIIGAIHHDFFIRQIAPDSSVLKGIRVEGIQLERMMSAINLRLSYFLGANYQLGEGFFLGTADKDRFISLARIFREQVIPMMTMWLDGDMEKMRYILGDNGKTRKDTVFFRETPFQKGLFKGNLPDSFDTEMHIYEINEAAFYNPRSYIEIYD